MCFFVTQCKSVVRNGPNLLTLDKSDVIEQKKTMRSRDARWILSKSWHNQPFAPDPFASKITKFAVS